MITPDIFRQIVCIFVLNHYNHRETPCTSAFPNIQLFCKTIRNGFVLDIFSSNCVKTCKSVINPFYTNIQISILIYKSNLYICILGNADVQRVFNVSQMPIYRYTNLLLLQKEG